MEVIRKVLTPTELIPEGVRYNPETDEFENWNGTGWQPNPGIDPRRNPAFQMPPRITDNTACDAAASMVRNINDRFDQAFTFTTIGGLANGLLFGLASLALTGIGLLIDVTVLIATSLISLGLAAVEIALTQAVYDQLECILYCNLNEDGQLTEASLAAVRAAVDEEIGGVAAVALNLMFDAYGMVLLNNAAAVGTETGDCDECACAWTYLWDFTVSSSDMVHNPTDGWTPTDGGYEPGSGFYGTPTGAGNACGDIWSTQYMTPEFTLPAGSTINRIRTFGDGTGVCGAYEVTIGTSRANGLSRNLYIQNSNPSGVQTDTGEIVGELTGLRVRFGRVTNAGTGYYQWLELRGTGDPPNFTGGAFI